MYNPESVLENETYKIRLDSEVQTDHLISARRPELVIVDKKKKKKKKICRIVEFPVLTDYRVKLNEGEEKDNYPDLTREFKKIL